MNTKTDSILGNLKWDEEYDSWTGQMFLSNEKTVKVKIGVDSKDSEIPIGIKTNFQFIKDNEELLRTKIAKPAAALYNDSWSEGDEIKESSIVKRISLEYISFFSNKGDAELFYNDDDLFAGHTITVFVEPNGEISEPNLAG
jgi:hypothetical protein